jgi:hydroxymethylglutaryl-CoA lyase
LVVDEVNIIEVGPRDGFQNLVDFIPTEKKADIIERLANSGEKYIEFSSFVSEKWIPQLADVAELYELIKDMPGVAFRALVADETGLERAIASGVKIVTWVVAATDSGNMSILNMTTDQSLEKVQHIGERLRDLELELNGIVAFALGDPVEGDVPVGRVLEIAEVFIQLGATSISVADTVGIASPQKVREIAAHLTKAIPSVKWGIHLHDILGLGMANAFAAWESGIRIFESSIGGLGGCPYAPQPGGNIATEELVYLLSRLGVDTGVSLDKLHETREALYSVIGDRPRKQTGHPI